MVSLKSVNRALFCLPTRTRCLDLKTGGSKWRQLLDHPRKEEARGEVLLHRTMKVWDDKAWLFIGNGELWAFDLHQEQWLYRSIVPAIPRAKFPYDDCMIDNAMVEIFEGIMYVFGGDDFVSHLGTNVLLAIDLKTMRWEHLTGTNKAAPSPMAPPMRCLAATWMVPAERMLYVLYGVVTRLQAKLHDAPYGNDDRMCEDMWSFHIDTRQWRRERLRGNPPCARAEMGFTYNPVLNRAVVYGGFSNYYSTVDGKPHAFTYYGDTFVQDLDTKIWLQVLTRSFPSHRAQSRLIVDEDTGKTYLFGGWPCLRLYLRNILMSYFRLHQPRFCTS